MATSTEINFLGDGGGVVGSSSNSTIESFFYTGVITAGDWVSFDPAIVDFADRVRTVEATDHTSVVSRNCIVGVALESVDASASTNYNGDKVKVCIAGGPVVAKVAATVAAGDVLIASSAAAGTALGGVQADTADYALVCGVALEDDVAGFARVLVARNLL